MSASHHGLPHALTSAIDACRVALDARPWEHPPSELQHAVIAALGPVPMVLHDAARMGDRLELATEETTSGATPPPASALLDLAAEIDRWPGLRRTFRLAQLSAQSVVPMWMHVHPDDERPLRLLDDLEDAALFAPRELALRDVLEREAHVADPALTALRAIILAHDVVTRSPKRVERTDLPDLCAYAWLDAPSELVPAARSGEPPARAEAWFRWWLEEAIPAAYRAA